jgi:hypothetical protein
MCWQKTNCTSNPFPLSQLSSLLLYLHPLLPEGVVFNLAGLTMSHLSRNLFIKLAEPQTIEQATPLVQQLLAIEDLGIAGILAIASTLINDPIISTALHRFSNELATYPGYPENEPRPHVLHLNEACLHAIGFYVQHALRLQGQTITQKDLVAGQTYAVQALDWLLRANPEWLEQLEAEQQKNLD